MHIILHYIMLYRIRMLQGILYFEYFTQMMEGRE